MSLGYADRLKHYPNKGVCGLPEKYDSERQLASSLKALVELVRGANHLVILTGAGISTSAGIPDFRGPSGIWTVQQEKDREAKEAKKTLKRERDEAKREAANQKRGPRARGGRQAEQVAQMRAVVGDEASDAHLEYLLSQARGRVDAAVLAYYEATNMAARAASAAAGASEGGAAEGGGGEGASGAGGGSTAADAGGAPPSRGQGAIDFAAAQPTLTHRALAELARRGKLQFLVTQNVDGLDQRGGYPRERLAVLHGCIFEEKCEACAALYLREHDVGTISFAPTGRRCARCGGVLRDTLLDWEDPLPEDELERAEEHCRRADVVLTLGTSLRIEPAGSLPQLARRYCIVNLQKTPKDGAAHLIVRAPVDVVMSTLMREVLGLELSMADGSPRWVECAGEAPPDA